MLIMTESMLGRKVVYVVYPRCCSIHIRRTVHNAKQNQIRGYLYVKMAVSGCTTKIIQNSLKRDWRNSIFQELLYRIQQLHKLAHIRGGGACQHFFALNKAIKTLQSAIYRTVPAFSWLALQHVCCLRTDAIDGDVEIYVNPNYMSIWTHQY
ncbi:hypothetical protein BD408DRAFT_21512 [Parasitella parasitica]|nr:hypothetical protein BD408DRAFT_21512 [Parasitella parasitica]